MDYELQEELYDRVREDLYRHKPTEALDWAAKLAAKLIASVAPEARAQFFLAFVNAVVSYVDDITQEQEARNMGRINYN